MNETALLLIAHGSRRAEANRDLEHLSEQLRGEFKLVQPSYLELCEPDIVSGGERCVNAGAKHVILLPYFLSAGMHVTDDLTAARQVLANRFPDATFRLAEPLGRHPLLAQIVRERANEAAMPRTE